MSNLSSALNIFKKRKKVVEARSVVTPALATDGKLLPQQSFPSDPSQRLGTSAQRATQTRYFRIAGKREGRVSMTRSPCNLYEMLLTGSYSLQKSAMASSFLEMSSQIGLMILS